MKRVATLVAVLLVAGCAGKAAHSPGAPKPQPMPSRSPINLVPDGYQGRFMVYAMVLENDQHGPQMCTFSTASMPPHCGGPDVIGWSWEGLEYESALDVKFGYYDLVGTWDGSRFTLTQKPGPGTNVNMRQPDTAYTSPCPPPTGGWKPVDPAKATQDAFEAATVIARQSPDFAGLWIDDTPPPDMATPMNDPARLILNIRFTKDLAEHEAQLRQVWGGSLCLSLAERTEAELQRIQQEVTDETVMSNTDPVSGTVEIGVWVAYESRQRELDAKYGPGVVILTGLLTPID